MTRVRAARLSALLFGVSLLVAGCGQSEMPGPKTGTAKGKVSFKGAPVSKGRIAFSNSQGGSGSAVLNADGTYQVSGLKPGEYQVIVLPPEAEVPKEEYEKFMRGEIKALPEADAADIPKKYRTATTSGLKTTIKEGANTFDADMQEG